MTMTHAHEETPMKSSEDQASIIDGIIPGAEVFDAPNHPLIRRVQKLPADLKRGRPIGRAYISGSRISTYTRCEASYYYKYVLKQREPDNSKTFFGTRLHEAQQAFLDWKVLNPDIPATPEIIDRVVEIASNFQISDDFVWKAPYPNAKTLEDELAFRHRVYLGVRAIMPVWEQLKPHSIEQGYLLEWKDESLLPILGFADFIETIVDPETGETYDEIVDLKTGSAKTEDDLVLNSVIPLYAAMNEIVRGVKTKRASFLNFVTNKEPKITRIHAPIPDHALARQYRKFADIAKRIDLNLFSPKDSADVCGKCTYRVACSHDFSIITDNIGSTVEIMG